MFSGVGSSTFEKVPEKFGKDAGQNGGAHTTGHEVAQVALGVECEAAGPLGRLPRVASVRHLLRPEWKLE